MGMCSLSSPLRYVYSLVYKVGSTVESRFVCVVILTVYPIVPHLQFSL